MSATAKKMIGTYIADDGSPKPAVKAWFQAECRNGRFQKVVEDFIRAQDELLDIHLIIVDKVEDNRVVCRIPCRLFDHESAGTFLSEVSFALNPLTGAIERICP